MLKPVEKPIKFVKNLSTKGKSYPITHVSAVIDDNGESIKSTIDSLKNKGSLTKVTWLELKDKRDAGKLIPGALYRITDYNCTTTQENTQSAGHQFDIVLLALSEDKLAEEGWAMMHDNIYDVTFADGVTKKCWIYDNGNNPMAKYNIVDAVTLKGLVISMHTIEIDEEHKTAVVDSYYSGDLEDEGLTYDYFQNSNLSAWKVWYCLDNDTARFAWADEDIPTFTCNINVPSAGWSFENVRVIRIYGADYDGRYAYVVINGDIVTNIATDRELKDSGDYTIYLSVYVSANAHVEILSSSVTGNGRGVIYRLIDEWNIDYPCDFKNMQTLVPMDSDGNIAMQNPVTSKYCYAFTDNTSGEPEDLSIKGHAINIKVKPNLKREAKSAMYFSPQTLFYTNRDDIQICIFSDITVGQSQGTIFINEGHAINIFDDSYNIILKNCGSICIGYNSKNIMLDTVTGSTFGSNCENKQITDNIYLNYGNGGVELATKDDLN